MKSIRNFIGKSGLFEKKEGRDKTARLFYRYVRNLVFFFLIAVFSLFAFRLSEAIAVIFVDMVIATAFGFYAIISLRLRKIEERIETGRAV